MVPALILDEPAFLSRALWVVDAFAAPDDQQVAAVFSARTVKPLLVTPSAHCDAIHLGVGSGVVVQWCVCQRSLIATYVCVVCLCV